MIVQCPECRTRFQLDEERVSSDQVKLRCSRCAHVFSLEEAAGPQTSLEKEPAGSEDGQPEYASWEADSVTGSAPEEAGAEESEDATEPGGASEDAGEIPAGRETTSDILQAKADVLEGLDEDAPPARRPPRKGLWILLVLILLAALSAAGYFLFPGLVSDLPFVRGGGTGSDLSQKAVTDIEEVKDIALQDVRQYFVNNEKVGELFVIEGSAVNNFPTVKERIKLQAELYDAQGQVVQSKQFLCGNTASLFQLQVLSREEINAVLQAKVGVLTNNTNLATGQAVPFMVVFYNPPGSVQEFGLSVVEARDPAEE